MPECRSGGDVRPPRAEFRPRGDHRGMPVDERDGQVEAPGRHALEFRLQRAAAAPHRHLDRFRLRREVLTRIDEAIPFDAVLLVVELLVAAVEPDQLVVVAALDHLAPSSTRIWSAL